MLDALGKAVVTGVYNDRPFPTEAELALQYNVSRSVTREAVKMLTAKGLVSARPRKGTVVEPVKSWSLFDPDVLRWLLERKFSLQLLRQFTELRLGLEPFAAALAATERDMGDILEVERCFQRMEAADRGGGDALAADIAFHIAVLRASNNQFYIQLSDLVDTALRISIQFTNRFKGRTASLPAHHDVLRAIRAGDGDGAQRAMHAIISDVMELIRAAEDQTVAAKA
jgi:DNA-binding FadR family transcriptional regulator